MSSILRQIARKLLIEAQQEDEEETGSDSIDEQLDKLFANYEKEASRAKNEGLDFRSMTRGFLLEAEDDEEEEEEPEEEEEDDEDKESEDEEGSDEDEEEEEEEKLTSEDIDVQSFANDVARLIENYDALLEIRNTILRRASNFLLKNYEKDVVDGFKQVISTEHGMEIGKSETEMQDKFQAPRAGFAGPAGGGA